MVLTSRTKIFTFALALGAALIMLLSFVGTNLPYFTKYMVLLTVFAVYVALIAFLERYSRRKKLKTD